MGRDNIRAVLFQFSLGQYVLSSVVLFAILGNCCLYQKNTLNRKYTQKQETQKDIQISTWVTSRPTRERGEDGRGVLSGARCSQILTWTLRMRTLGCCVYMFVYEEAVRGYPGMLLGFIGVRWSSA